MNFSKLTALELSKKLKTKKLPVVEVTKAQIDYIKLMILITIVLLQYLKKKQ